MVKRVLFAFALGAWCLQQCANLPALTLCAGLAMPAVLSVAGLALACRWTGAHGYGPWPRLLLPCAILALALSAGFGWSAWRAERRLQLGLPHNLEQRDLIVSGVVRGLPESFDYGTRFVFQIIRYEPLVAPHGTVRQSRGAAGRDAPTAPAPALKLPPDLPQTVLLTWYLPSRPAQPTQPAGGPQARPLAARQPPELEAGQRWRLAVRLIRPHGNANEFGSDRERWMLERDLRASGTVQSNAPSELLGYARGWQLNALLDAVDRWRGRLRQRIETVLAGAAHAGVVVALATGAQAAISAQDWQRFTQTGTNHLVAISGLHVSLVAGLCAWLAGWFWRNAARLGLPLPLLLPAQYVAALAGVAAAGAYIALAGFGVPAQRAWWMLLVAALALISGRNTGVATILAWALGWVVLIDPWAVASPGLALSFSAVAAVLLVASSQRREVLPASPSRLLNSPMSGPMSSSVSRLVSRSINQIGGWLARAWRHLNAALRLHWAVTVALLPLSIAWFSQVPLAGVPANLVAIPWVSLLVTPLVLLGVLLPAPLDAWAYRGAHQLLSWLSIYFDGLMRLPWVVWHVPTPDPPAFLLALAGVGWWLMPRGWPLRRYGLILLGPLLWPCRVEPAPGEFRVTVLDVGQGGSTLIETATHRMLFDAGPGPESTDAGQRVVLPFLQAHGIAKLDLLMISHGDSDHAGGAAAVLGGVRVARVRASVPPGQRLWQQVQAAGVADQGVCLAGTRWTWDAVNFEVLWPVSQPDPAAPNQTACVLRVSNRGPSGAHAVLLTADIEAAAEQALTDRMAALEPGGLAAEVVLAPHHGSKTSSSGFILEAIMPREVVFQVGYLNRFHHPHPSVVERYRALGASLFRSDADGEVRFETRGARLDAMRYRVRHRRYWMGR